MKNFTCATRGRLGKVLGASVLLAGGIGASALVSAGTAEAATCTATVSTPCAVTGQLIFSAGTLTATVPTALAWSGSVTGVDQKLVDPTTADQSYLVNDATGSGAGWSVTISATTFKTAGSLTLADAGTFSTNGSATLPAATTAPAAVCVTTGDCTLPTDTTTYPMAITTAATPPAPTTIYHASSGSGLGSITIGTVPNPVAWWLNLPGYTKAGTYNSTISLAVISGP